MPTPGQPCTKIISGPSAGPASIHSVRCLAVSVRCTSNMISSPGYPLIRRTMGHRHAGSNPDKFPLISSTRSDHAHQDPSVEGWCFWSGFGATGLDDHISAYAHNCQADEPGKVSKDIENCNVGFNRPFRRFRKRQHIPGRPTASMSRHDSGIGDYGDKIEIESEVFTYMRIYTILMPWRLRPNCFSSELRAVTVSARLLTKPCSQCAVKKRHVPGIGEHNPIQTNGSTPPSRDVAGDNI
jgi:hypothetical protein